MFKEREIKEGMDLTGVRDATSDAGDSRNVEDEGSEQKKTNLITTSTIILRRMPQYALVAARHA